VYRIDRTVVALAIDSDLEINFERFVRYHNVIIFDEMSQLTEEQKRKAVQRYRFHKVVFVGDPGFQLGPITGETMSLVGLRVFRYEENHRIHDPVLLGLVQWLRELIAEGLEAQEIKRAFLQRMCAEFPEHVLSVKAVKRLYDIDDRIICATNKGTERIQGRAVMWTQLFEGRFAPHEKYLVTSNRSGHFNNGDVVVGEQPPSAKSFEICHALSVHKVQGETLASGKLFIDLYRMWEVQHLFTACSRPVTMDQVFVVDDAADDEDEGLLTGRVYAVRSPNTDREYIGSTMGSLAARLRKHRVDMEAYQAGKRKYEVTSAEVLRAGGAYIELLEEVRCESRAELVACERVWIARTLSAVNKKMKQ
jgi:hypothetical protein